MNNSKQKKILFISHDSAIYGAQKILLNIIKHIDRSVFEPILAVPIKGPLSEQAEAAKIKVYITQMLRWVPDWRVGENKKKLLYSSKFLLTIIQRCYKLKQIIDKESISLVYSNTATVVEGAIVSNLMKIPHIWHIHEHLKNNNEISLLMPKKVYYITINKLADRVIFCSKSLSKEYKKNVYKSKIVYNGVKMPLYYNKALAKKKIIEKFSINPENRIVGIVGAINPRKGHSLFINAAEKIFQTRKDITFLIVGSGFEGYTKIIEKEIKNKNLMNTVKLCGWWEEEKIHELLSAIDVLAICSNQESFGLTAIEALSVETPVVSTKCGGPEEIIKNNVNGILVPTKNYSALADAILRIIDQREIAKQISLRGKKYVSDNFSNEAFIENVQKIICATIETK